jgi:hypothetical protein
MKFTLSTRTEVSVPHAEIPLLDETLSSWNLETNLACPKHQEGHTIVQKKVYCMNWTWTGYKNWPHLCSYYAKIIPVSKQTPVIRITDS